MTINHKLSCSPFPTESVNAHDYDPAQLLTEQATAVLLCVSCRTLQGWRLRGGGPPYVRVSARCIRYRRTDLVAFAVERIRQSTSHVDHLSE